MPLDIAVSAMTARLFLSFLRLDGLGLLFRPFLPGIAAP